MFPKAKPKNISYKTVHNDSATDVQYDEDLKSVLRRYDKDGDGVLNREELKKAFENLGCRIPGWRAIRALCHADQNRDGCISEKELASLVQYAIKKGYVL